MKIQFLAAAMMLVPVSGFAQVGPSKKDVSIKNFSFSGDGCPKGTADIIVTNSNAGSKTADYFQITYDDFQAKAGPGIDREANTRMCASTFEVLYPKGYRFRIENIQYDGHAELENTAIVAQVQTTSEIIFGDKVKSRSYFRGPFNKNFKHVKKMSGKFDTGCGKTATPLNIQTKIRIRGEVEKYTGKVTMDTVSGQLTQAFRMKWEKC